METNKICFILIIICVFLQESPENGPSEEIYKNCLFLLLLIFHFYYTQMHTYMSVCVILFVTN
jgi:hypothetical protein